MKKRLLVVCPGRGSYTKEELGYLKRNASLHRAFLQDLDQRRQDLGEPSISELDGAESFKVSVHTKGEHTSPLIYACAYSDFMAIDRDRFEIVAICGNSMGWYLSLAFSEAMDWAGSFKLIQTMGGMMRSNIIGAQFIYPLHKEDWTWDQELYAHLHDNMTHVNAKSEEPVVFESIRLGHYAVIAGEVAACDELQKMLKPIEHFPMRLINHGAFHTPLMKPVSVAGFESLHSSFFGVPKIPLIDGQGKVWNPHSSSARELREYTLKTQVMEVYDFTKSIEMGLKEFAPDHIALLGPGSSLGGAIGQCLVGMKWKGIQNKQDFIDQQKKTSPMVLSMGLAEQREVLERPDL